MELWDLKLLCLGYKSILLSNMYRWLPYGTMCFGVSALVMVGYSRSLMCAPNGIVLDIDSHIFEVSTIYEHGVC